MNLLSFTAFILFLILFVGFYLLTADEVSGGAKIGLIVFLVLVSIYLLLNLSMFRSYYEVIDIPIDATVPSSYDKTKFSRIDQNYTLSTWIYIDDWNYNFGQMKNVLFFERKTDKDTKINLDTFDNNLIIQYWINKDNGTSGTTAQYEERTISIPNINIQKWVNITVCFNTNNTDTYINGKLIDTDVHAKPIYSPANAPNNPNLGALHLAKALTGANSGFSGKIGMTRYYGRVISPKEAWDIYTAGPTTNLLGNFLNRYNATFTFLQDNKEVQKISIM